MAMDNFKIAYLFIKIPYFIDFFLDLIFVNYFFWPVMQ